MFSSPLHQVLDITVNYFNVSNIKYTLTEHEKHLLRNSFNTMVNSNLISGHPVRDVIVGFTLSGRDYVLDRLLGALRFLHIGLFVPVVFCVVKFRSVF